MQFTLCFCIF